MLKNIKRFVKDESGVTAIEYALIAAFMGVMVILAMPTISNSGGDLLNKVGNKMGEQNNKI